MMASEPGSAAVRRSDGLGSLFPIFIVLVPECEEQGEGFFLALGAFPDTFLPAPVSGRQRPAKPLPNERGEILGDQVGGVDAASGATDKEPDLIAVQECGKAGEGTFGVAPIQVSLVANACKQLPRCVQNCHTLSPYWIESNLIRLAH